MRNATSHATTPTAAPCTDCGTTGGYIPRSYLRPSRQRGMCWRCYQRSRRCGRLPQEWTDPHMVITPEQSRAGTLHEGAILDLRPFRLPVPPRRYAPLPPRRIAHAPWIGEALAFLAETDDLTLTEAA